MKRQSSPTMAIDRPSRQDGLANLLLILLISLSLTTVVMGGMYATRGAQSGQMALHAQTQAQVRSMAGVQALTAFLSSQASGTVSSINNGTIASGTQTVATYSQAGTCPGGSSYYCFDVSGSSGGATSIVRARYLMQSSTSQSIGSDSQVGSVFADGLSIGGNSTLTGIGQPTVAVGGTAPKPNIPSITFVDYKAAQFIQPDDVRAQANYIYLSNGSCYVNNLAMNDATGKTTVNITQETSCSDSRFNSATNKPILAGTNTIQFSASNGYTVNIATKNSSKYTQLPPGVYWFDGAVDVVPEDSNAIQVNAIVATGSITSEAVKSSYMYAYAPSFYPNYYRNAKDLSGNSLNLSNTPDRTCNNAANVLYPTQICQNGAITSNTSTWPGMVANIIFLTATDLTLGGGDGNSGATTNYLGNLISSTGRGGTGNQSGKFTGNGNINITGNIVNYSTTVVTTFNGTLDMTLTNATSGGGSIPVWITTTTYSLSLYSLSYL